MASKGAIQAGKGEVTLGVNKTPLQKGLEEAKKEFQSFGKAIASMGAGIAAAGAAVSAPFLAGLKVFGDLGGEIVKASRISGIGMEELQTVASGLRISFEDLALMSKKMDQFIASAARGSPDAVQRLAQLGLSLQDLQKMTEGERVIAIGVAIERTFTDVSQQHEAQTHIFGKNALQADFTGNLGGRMNTLKDLGGVMSNDDVNLAKEFGKAMREMGIAIQGVWARIGAVAAPMMTEFFRFVTMGAKIIQKLVDAHRPLLDVIFRVADKVVLLGGVVAAIGGIVYAVGSALPFLGPLGAVIAAVFSPVGLTLAAVGIGIYALVKLFPSIGDAAAKAFQAIGTAVNFDKFSTEATKSFRAIADAVKPIMIALGDTWQGVTDAMGAGNVELAMQVAFLGIKLAWMETVDSLTEPWRACVDNLAGLMLGFLNGTKILWEVWLAGVKAGWVLLTHVFSAGWEEIKSAIASVIDFLADKFDTFVTGARIAWIKLQGAITLERQATTDAKVAEEGTGLAQRRQVREAEGAERGQQREQRRTDVTRDLAALDTPVREAVDTGIREQQQLEAETAATPVRTAEGREDKRKTREALEWAGIEARYQRDMAGLARGEFDPPALPKKDATIGGKDPYSSAGTFSADAARLMQGANSTGISGAPTLESIATQQIDLTRQQNRLLQGIVDELQNSEGLVML